MVANITRAARTQWTAAATLLERRFPEDFGRRDRIRHDHAGQIGLQIEPAKMDVESILLAAALEERMALEDQRLSQVRSSGPETLLLPPGLH
jgi:hypothetical protein